MTKLINTLVTYALSLTASSVVSAADWNVVQTTTVSTANPSMTQSNAAFASQAVNAVVLDTTSDDISSSTQSVTAAGASVSFTQTDANTNGSVQSLNLASARSISGLTQQVSGFATVTMTQDVTAGTGNVQALNYSVADGNTTDLSQTVTAADVVTVNNSTGNVQAMNYAESATYSGTLVQTTTLTNLNVTNLGGTDLRVNSVQGDTSGLTTPISQTATIGTVTVNGASTVILNHVGP